MRAVEIGGLIAFILLGAGPATADDQLLFASTRLDLGNGATAGDHLGTSVAVSGDGNLMVTGAPLAGARGTQSGAVYTFVRNPVGGDWGPALGPLTAGDTTAFDAFGYSVALSGDGRVLAVGAPLNDRRVGNGGAVYVFRRNLAANEPFWLPPQVLTVEDAQEEDQLGTSVAASADGSIIVAGAPQPNPRTRPSGKAYVFVGGPEGVWSQAARLTGGGASDFFGYAVAVDADGTVLAGVPGSDPQGRFQAGAVYVFADHDGSWSTPPERHDGAEDGDELGVSVAAGGGTLAAGARAAVHAGPGSVYVLRGGSWRVGQVLTAGTAGGGLGMSVAVSRDGRTILAGAWKDAAEAPDAGAAFLFRSDGQGHRLGSCGGPAAGAELGRSVALGGPIAAAGAHLADVEAKNDAGTLCALDLTGLSIDLSTSVPVAGAVVEYTVTVRNASSVAVEGAAVSDTFPAESFVDGVLTCLDMVCTSTGTGVVRWLVPALAAGGEAVFHLSGRLKPEAVGTVGNEARLIPPTGFLDFTENDNVVNDGHGVAIRSDLSVQLTADQPQHLRGEVVAYTLVVRSAGPSRVEGVRVRETFNRDALLPVRWTCQAGPGNRCPQPGGIGDIAENVSLAPGSQITFRATATIRLNTSVRELVSQAALTRPQGLAGDPEGNNERRVTTILPVANLQVTLTARRSEVVPGEAAMETYSIEVRNAGPDRVLNARIRDSFPAVLSMVTWTCAGRNGGICGVETGSGDLDTRVDLPPGGSVVYSVTAGALPGATGTAVDTASAEVPRGVYESQPSDNESAELSIPLSPRADLSVQFQDPGTAIPGNALPTTLSFTVSNSGPSTVQGATVTTALDPGIIAAAWTCTANDGPCSASGNGNLNDRVNLGVNSTRTYTFRLLVAPGAFGSLTIRASIEPPRDTQDPDTTHNSAVAMINLTPIADLSITRHDGPLAVVPGNPLPSTYTFEVANVGPSDARGVRVRHDFAPDLGTVTWTCEALRGSCAPSGTGEIRQPVSLQTGGRLTYTVRALAGPEMPSGDLTVLAVVFFVDPTVSTDPRSSNNQLAVNGVVISPVADLAISVSPDQAGPGAGFTLRVTNAGPSDVRHATVLDTFTDPAAVSWLCQALRGSCTPSGNGTLQDLVSLRVGGTLTYRVSATASSQLSGEASVACDSGDCFDPRPGNNTASNQ